MLKITKVKRNSVAKAYGLEVGDSIVAFDGYPCEDELDYLYYCSLGEFEMTVKNGRDGEELTITVEKDENEELGLEFEKHSCIKLCQNRCVFCFVDQMPKGMRKSLYVKDDDYGMSFTCGNFVTLTNLSDEALDRIVRLKLSPLYISVHTMDPELRVKLLRNRFAGKIVDQVDKLFKGGIEMHCQAVIVPNMNDGDALKYTARKLFSYYPTVKDLACVPTGLTKYRDGLYEIEDIDKAYAEKFLALVDELNEEFGVNFIKPADEYFVRAERPLKPVAFYGDFEQIENGIGLSVKFRDEFFAAIDGLKKGKDGKFRLKKEKNSLWICGVSAAKLNADLVAEAESKISGLSLTCMPVINNFFGETVTCTGLLTGVDICAAVKAFVEEKRLSNPKYKLDEIILANNVLKEFEDVFLCGMTLKEMKEQLPFTSVRVNGDGGYGFVRILTTNAKGDR